MNTTGIYTIDNQVVMKRYYKDFEELKTYVFQLPEFPSDEELDRLKNEVPLKEKQDILAIDGDGLEVIHQFYVDDNLGAYVAWVKNSQHLYYISIDYYVKKAGEIMIKKTTLKPKFFNEIVVLDKDFIKTKNEVFYLGKKIAGAHAESFEKVENTQFYQDNNCVYSFEERLVKITIAKEPRLFVPYLYYFADNVNIYRHDNWTKKIIPVDNEKDRPALHNVLEALQKNKNWQKIELLNDDASANAASVAQWNDLGQFKTYASVFNYFFPEAKAKWNEK